MTCPLGHKPFGSEAQMHKILFFLILILVFVGGFILAKNTLDRVYKDISFGKTQQTPPVSGGCDDACQKIVANEVSRAIATISGTEKKSTIEPGVSATPVPQVSYIPLDGTFSTTSTGWTDAYGIEVSFDLAKDCPAGAKVSWEASLRVANANGQAYARLFDVTHGIAVDGSEISVTNNANYQRVSSGNLNLWSGRNVYRVQVKSLNSLDVDYTGGKIRISY